MKPINHIILLGFILFVFCSCNQNEKIGINKGSNLNTNLLEKKIIGDWTINKIERPDGNIDNVPNEHKYTLKLSKKKDKNIFQVEDVNGIWHLEDSLLIMENIPVSKTYIDSVFVINDAFGNSEVILKNGNEKIASITKNGVVPEKITSLMTLVFLDNHILKLSMEGDIHIYNKK